MAAVPAASPVPKVLLIDGDQVFARVFRDDAVASGVPVRTVSSHLSLSPAATGPFDLILLDWETAGEEFTAEVARDMGLREKPQPVMIIGDHRLKRLPKKYWPKNVLGYSDKRLGSEAVLADALLRYEIYRLGRAAMKDGDQCA